MKSLTKSMEKEQKDNIPSSADWTEKSMEDVRVSKFLAVQNNSAVQAEKRFLSKYSLVNV